ncbi:UDP-N-acetylmuramate dehydrogenase [Candidatus Omnitrophota bacterium]
MLVKEVRDKLLQLCKKYGDSVVFDHPLCDHSTISIGGKAAAWYVPFLLDGLCRTKTFLDDSGIRTIPMGNGSNILIPDEGLDAVVVNLSGAIFKEIKIEGNTAVAGAGANLGTLMSNCCTKGLAGLEGLIGIPATVGGALVTNAAYRSAISERLSRVLVLSEGAKVEWVEKKDIQFGYRFSSIDRGKIILQAVFQLDKANPDELKKKLKHYFFEKMEKQPLTRKTLGCIFKNPTEEKHPSGRLIEEVSMKGYRSGAAEVSEKHANFIINTGGASSRDVTNLMDEIRVKVRDKFSIELETEIEVLGA